MIVKNLRVFLSNQSIRFYVKFKKKSNKFEKLKTIKQQQQLKAEKKKTNVSDADSELYNELIEKYEFFILSTKENWIIKINLKSCLLKDIIIVSGHNMKKMNWWRRNDWQSITDWCNTMPPLEGDEKEERNGKVLKIKPLLTRFPIILAEIKQLKIIKKWNQTNTVSFVSS